MRSLDIIVPCYNEAECLSALYEKIQDVLSCINVSWQIIFVNDGSKDKTLDVLKLLESKFGRKTVKYLSFSRNFGKEAAIYAGLSFSNADYAVLMDADLQHPPELLPQMIDILESGYDCCGARRTSRAGELKFRSFLSNLFYKIINKVTSMDLVPGGSDFRMIKHSVVNAMLSLQESERFTKGLLSWVGFTTKWIPYENVERTLGKTKWSFKALFNYALNGYISFAIIVKQLENPKTTFV